MRILLAEDEKEMSNALVAILKHNNYSVDAVYNGADALDYGLSENYDVIILDIMMPKMSGIEVLEKLRENGMHIPILMLAAKSQIEDRILGLDKGADDYLSKPFAMGQGGFGGQRPQGEDPQKVIPQGGTPNQDGMTNPDTGATSEG